MQQRYDELGTYLLKTFLDVANLESYPQSLLEHWNDSSVVVLRRGDNHGYAEDFNDVKLRHGLQTVLVVHEQDFQQLK
jgi:hypothetical protein